MPQLVDEFSPSPAARLIARSERGSASIAANGRSLHPVVMDEACRGNLNGAVLLLGSAARTRGPHHIDPRDPPPRSTPEMGWSVNVSAVAVTDACATRYLFYAALDMSEASIVCW